MSREPKPQLYTFCPNCGVKINYRERAIGTIRRCDACGQKVLLTAPGVDMRIHYCRFCDRDTSQTRQPVHHSAHFLMTLLTAGLWIFVWVRLRAAWICAMCGEDAVPKPRPKKKPRREDDAERKPRRKYDVPKPPPPGSAPSGPPGW